MIELLGLPPLASEHGGDVDKFIFYVHIVMGALFVGWLAYFAYALYRFRASKNAKASYVGVKSHASSYIEGGVVIAEAVLLLGFAIPLWSKAVDDFPDPEDSTLIHVVARQFNWNARHAGPDGVLGDQDRKFVAADNPYGTDPNDPKGEDDVTQVNAPIKVPVNKPVIAYVSSEDVVHSFKINAFRVTQDAIPGMMIPVWFEPTKEGRYIINCAQLCGNSHAYMIGYLDVVSQREYDQWLNEQAQAQQAAPAIDSSMFE